MVSHFLELLGAGTFAVRSLPSGFGFLLLLLSNGRRTDNLMWRNLPKTIKLFPILQIFALPLFTEFGE
jgi:hypothetical protein